VLPAIVLASESPRRRQILESLAIPFSFQAPNAEELHPDRANIEEGILINAKAKARKVLSRLDKNQIVVAADTLVVQDQEVIGKPNSPEDVINTLTKFSGKEHLVYTGMVLASEEKGFSETITITKILFRDLTRKEIENYARTIEPYDKAGAYAIQGLGTLFIQKMEGSYTNSMGFPLETFLKDLEKFSGTPLYQWFLKK